MSRPINTLICYCLLCLPLRALALEPGEERAPDLSGVSEGGVAIAIYSELSPLRLNRLHAWRIHLTDADGEPLTGAELELTGGMPDHDHGLPTLPLISGETAAGVYLLQGMRLHMPGRWVITIDIDSPAGEDEATLEFQL